MKVKTFNYKDLEVYESHSLKDSAIHVWWLEWKKIIPWIKKHWFILSEDELAYVEKFKRDDDQMRSATGKIIARFMIAHYTGLSHEDIKIEVQGFGKPYFSHENSSHQVSYSVSHSEEIVMVAFTRLPAIGADVEKIRPLTDYRELAAFFFAKEECEAIMGQGDLGCFYKYWTAKEAFVKALGKGLHMDLKSFVIKGNFSSKSSIKINKWHIILLDVIRDYAACLVVEMKSESVNGSVSE
jgi:4'-phosphopantetheinyl transferase